MSSKSLFSSEEDTSTEESEIHSKRSDSPEPSCLSMKSDQSKDKLIYFKVGDSVTEHILDEFERSDSCEPSCLSIKSDQSKSKLIYFRKGESFPDLMSMNVDQPVKSLACLRNGASFPNLRYQTERAKQLTAIFRELEHTVLSLVKMQLKRFKNLLSPDYPACTERQVEDEEDQSSVREGALKITLHVLRNMNQTDLANTLQTKLAPRCYQKLKSKLRESCQKIKEGISMNSALLNEIYTELYITEGGSGEVSNEHEVRQIESTSRRPATQETPIKCSDIFRPLPGQDKAIRTVLTKGVAGIGKTFSVQKFILDWAEGQENQDVLLIFPIPFRELNLMKEKKISLMDLLQNVLAETKELKPNIFYKYKVMFIFDGLDECRLPLNFQHDESLFDITKSTSVNVLLTNLIKGNLLPSALLWITSRPAAANQIPPEFVDQVTEVRGFNDPQKEEYFQRRIRDQSLANRIITHMKSSRSLYIMCHIPVFCWIATTVLERMLGEAESGEIPKTLTQMFTRFLIFQIKHRSLKYHGEYNINLDKIRETIMILGKLAWEQLEKGNLIFYEEDLRERGIDVREISVYSGVCTQIFREEFGLHLSKVFSFVHLSVQEFLAALYTFLIFICEKKNVLEHQSVWYSALFNKSTVCEFLKSAVDKALQSENGHLDLFLRFLLGLSLETNQSLLRGIIPEMRSTSHTKEEIVKYIKEKIKENPCPEKSINLFHCLNELNDSALVHEVQIYLNRRSDSRLEGAKLSPAQWSALVFLLLNSNNELEEFDLKTFEKSEECLQRLLPVVTASRKAVLFDCNLTKNSCAVLASALSSKSSSLMELYLSNNELQDSGAKLLSAGLENPHCKLVTLWLSNCRLTEEGCAALALALSKNLSTHLRELNLNDNETGDSGLKHLSALLKYPHCKLEKLELEWCSITEEGCAALASALGENPSHLRELNLNYNKPGDSGVEQLSHFLQNAHCKLEKLHLCDCYLKEKSCAALALALSSSFSSLRELNLSGNELQDSGAKLLSPALGNPHCKLEKLRLFNCNLTENSCKNLVSVLTSNSSLTELDMGSNALQDSGAKLLSAELKSPCCKLEILKLSACSITEEGCAALATALRKNPSHLRQLNLSNNKLGDSGVKKLSAVLEDPQCKLEKLQLSNCNITKEGCAVLASTLKKKHSSLKELNLSSNKPGDSGVKQLSVLKEDPQCTLEKLEWVPDLLTDTRAQIHKACYSNVF